MFSTISTDVQKWYVTGDGRYQILAFTSYTLKGALDGRGAACHQAESGGNYEAI